MNQREEEQIEEVVEKWEHVTWCANQEEKNEAYRKADEANMPVIWIATKRRYGNVTSDFIQVDGYRGLKEDVRDGEIDQLVHYYMGRTLHLSKPHHKDEIMGFVGGVTPGMHGLRVREIPEFADRLAEIMFDESNWAPFA